MGVLFIWASKWLLHNCINVFSVSTTSCFSVISVYILSQYWSIVSPLYSRSTAVWRTLLLSTIFMRGWTFFENKLLSFSLKHMIKYLTDSVVWLPVIYRAPGRGNVFPKGCRIVIAYRKIFSHNTARSIYSKDFFFRKSWYNLTFDSLNNTTFNSVCLNVIHRIKPKIFLKASPFFHFYESEFHFSVIRT